MRSGVFLTMVMVVAASARGGQIIVEEAGGPLPPTTGKVSFSGKEFVEAPGRWFDGAWLAGVDILGDAGKLDAVSGKTHAIFGSAEPAGPPDAVGWTHYDLRWLNLFFTVNADGTATYINGARDGLFIHLFNGYFSTVQGMDTPNSPSNDTLYLSDGTPTNSGAIVVSRLYWELPDGPYGDGNSDGRVDLNDFGLLKANFGQYGFEPFTHGDLTGNAFVNLNDFAILKQNFGWRAAAVPEPSGLALVFVAVIGVSAPLGLRTRWRRPPPVVATPRSISSPH